MKYSSGTSPRMRGKRSNSNQFFIAYGNIPAYAGKTCYRAQTGREFPEHPRVCGENLPYGLPLGIGEGTSPRMRGKHVPAISRARRIRNIPAYAGKTLGVDNRIRSRWEHPRVCGENGDARPHQSPPGGNIPAYAGKTSNPLSNFTRYSEHPRVCGENECWIATPAPGMGTSPRMRGKHDQSELLHLRHGNIPAYAGKTPRCGRFRRCREEHPRVCGENNHGRTIR